MKIYADSSVRRTRQLLGAMARQPMHSLARVSHDPAGAWRRGDPAVIRALAELELRDSWLAARGR